MKVKIIQGVYYKGKFLRPEECKDLVEIDNATAEELIGLGAAQSETMVRELERQKDLASGSKPSSGKFIDMPDAEIRALGKQYEIKGFDKMPIDVLIGKIEAYEAKQ